MSTLDRLSSGPKAWLILFLITLVAAAPGVFNLPALDRDESRYAQASKQMLETDDYIRIRYQDEMRNKKPAGIYWLQAGATAALAGDDNKQIWTYRVPSWIGAALATLAAFWAGIILVGRRAAFVGSALFGSSILLTSEAHIAKTDAVLVLTTTLAMGALARLYLKSGNARRMALVVWLAIGLGFLIKGPVTPLIVILTVFTLIALDRTNWRWAKPLLGWRGPLLFAVLVVPWLVSIQIATDGAFLDEAIGKDLRDKVAGSSEGHGGPPGYHLAYIPTHLFPATILLIPAMVLAVLALWRKTPGTQEHDERPGLRFLLAWALPFWLFFELMPTKLSHYTLPAYPALGLLSGWVMIKLGEGAHAPVSRYASLLVFGLGAGLLLFASSPMGDQLLMSEALEDFKTASPEAVLTQWSDDMIYPLWLWGAGVITVIGIFVAAIFRRIGLGVALAIFSSLLIGWHIRGVFLPAQQWVQPTFVARAALASVCGLPTGNPDTCMHIPASRVQSVGYPEPSFVFTVGTNSTIPPHTVIDLPQSDARYPVAYLLNMEQEVGASALEQLIAEARTEERCVSQSTPFYALDYSNGDPVVFLALRFDAEPCPAE